jgi:hypothetical protein
MIPEFNPDWIVEDPEPAFASAQKAPTRAVTSLNDDANYVPLILNGVEIPRVRAAELRAMSKVEYDQWLADREACLRDQLVLSRVMGLDLVENPHRAMFDFFGRVTPGTPLSKFSDIPKKMCLLPRGLGKTFGIRVQEIYMILNFPHIRICFLTGGESLGKRQLAQVKQVFRRPTAEFLRLFPEFCTISVKNKKGVWHDEDPDWGNAHEFNVPARGESILPEPTFAISTAKAVKAGSHFDYIVIDDLVNDGNWQSAPLLEKSYQDYIDICPLLDPHAGAILCTGTRYAAGDCYDKIQVNAQETAVSGQAPTWAFLIRDCWSTDCSNPKCKHSAIAHSRNGLLAPCTVPGCDCSSFASDGVKKCLFPVVTKLNGEPFGHTIEFLQKTLAELGKRYFACQYLNAPELAAAFKTFSQALIDACTIDISQMPPRNISTSYLCGEMAYAISEDADDTVIFAFQKSGGAHYIWACWWGKFTASDRADLLLHSIKKVRPETCFIEKNMGSDSFMLNLNARAVSPEFGLIRVPITWTELHTHTKNAKKEGIANMQLSMQGKRLFFAVQDMNGVKEMQGTPGAYHKLVQQLLKFPSDEGHDDFADCASQVAAAVQTGYLADALPVPKSRRNWLQELNQPQEPLGNGQNDGSNFCS